MKKIIILSSLILAEAVLGIVYGLTPKDNVSTLVFFALGAAVAFCVFLVCSLKYHRFSDIIVKVTVFSLIFGIVPYIVCTVVNQISGEFVAEYTVTVEHILGHGSGSVSFYTPDGDYGTAELHDNRIIILDGEESVDVGDTITVREYIGLFKNTYYVFVEEVYP